MLLDHLAACGNVSHCDLVQVKLLHKKMDFGVVCHGLASSVLYLGFSSAISRDNLV